MLKLELCRIGKEQIRFDGVVIGYLDIDHNKFNIDVDYNVLKDKKLEDVANEVARAYFDKHIFNTPTCVNEILFFEFTSYDYDEMEWLTVKELTLTITPDGDIL